MPHPRIILEKDIEKTRGNGAFWANFRSQASQKGRVLLFPEGNDPRVLSAATFLAKHQIAKPILLGEPEPIRRQARDAGWAMEGVEIWDPRRHPHAEPYAVQLFERRKAKGLTEIASRELIEDPLYFACMALRNGAAHGVVAGAVRTTADTVKAAFGCLGLAAGASTVFGLFIMDCPNAAEGGRKILFADSAVSPRPSPRALAAVGIESARFYERFIGKPARVAYLSFSTRGSAEDESIELIRQAVASVRQKAPDLAVDGEIQGDAALIRNIAEQKGAGDSSVAGQANVMIFPDLNASNIAYKLVQHLGGARAVGPFLMGLSAPMTDLSRGCDDEDIVDAAAIVSLMETPRP